MKKINSRNLRKAGLVLILVLLMGACTKENGESLVSLDTELEEYEGVETAYEDTETGETEERMSEAEQTESKEEAIITGGLAIANPIQEVDYEDLVELTGIPLAIPVNAEDVVYTVINGTDSVAQAKFVYNGKEYCYRACATAEFEPTDISGLYYEWEAEESVEVSYCAGKIYLREGMGVICWIDIVPGINYTLSCQKEADKEEMLALVNELFVEVQGDAK